MTVKERGGGGAGGEYSRENRPHGWHEFLESHFESLSMQLACKWEVIDSRTVEAFFLCETFSFADGWLHKPACFCSHFPSRILSLPNFNFRSSLLFIEFLKDLQLLRGEMLLQTCSFLEASVMV